MHDGDAMRRRCFCFVVAICGVFAGEAFATEREEAVHHARHVLATQGPTRAVAEMTANGNWRRFIDLISSGDVGAISLVRELAKGTDASSSEELTITLAEALPKAPRDVLGVLTPDQNSPLSYSRVCSAPFIEDTARHRRAYKAAALRAVRRVFRRRDPDLVQASGFCISELRKIKG